MSTSMNLTRIKIRLNDKKNGNEHIKAYATIILNDFFRISGLKIIKGTNGLFVNYPSRKDASGKFYELVGPVDKNSRNILQEKVMHSFERSLSKVDAA